MIVPIRINGRDLKPHKATIAPLLAARTVLTKSPWEFVSLWLTREEKKKALFYWDQARAFARAASGMPVQSSPLLHYYSFMNAAKALLVSKGIAFVENHGVGAHNATPARRTITLVNEGVRIRNSGILPALATYLCDTETTRDHSLQELLFNLPFVHRTYCLTYRAQRDQFFALTDCEYVFDTGNHSAYLRARLSAEFAQSHNLARLPNTFIRDPQKPSDNRAIRSVASATIARRRVSGAADMGRLIDLHQQVRRDVQYINATQTLWYLRVTVPGPRRLARSPLVLTLAAMHRLSELCRYRPIELASFLSGQKNWLLTEFVTNAPEQFLDGIASELTGHQFMLPNVRPAT
jgi:hypothetical protein